MLCSIAEAIRLSNDRDLRVGQVLTVPNLVSGNYNDFKSFKPYDAGKITADPRSTIPVRREKGDVCGGLVRPL